MFFIPLNQIESVELVIHALRVAGGEADCSTCPVRRVCMKQCLAVGEAVARMMESGNLPHLGAEGSPDPQEEAVQENTPPKKDFLKVIK